MTKPGDISSYKVVADEAPSYQINIGVKDDYITNMSKSMIKLLIRELEFSKIAISNDKNWIVIRKASVGGWKVDELDAWIEENSISNSVVSSYGCAFQNKEDAELFVLRWL